MSRFLQWLVPLFIVGGLFVLAVPAAADPDEPESNRGTWGIRPAEDIPFYTIELQAGESYSGTLAAVNTRDDESIVLAVDLVAAINAERGGFAMSRVPSPIESWFNKSHETVTVQPRSRESVDWALTVPEGTQTGEYVAAWVAFQPDAEDESEVGNVFIKIIDRVGVAILIRVGNPTICGMQFKELESGFLKSGDYRLKMTWENIGEVSFKGTGEATLTPRASNRPAESWPLVVGFSAMGLDMYYPVFTDQPPAAGAYDFTAFIESSEVADCRAEWSGLVVITGADAKDADTAREVYKDKIAAAEAESIAAAESNSLMSAMPFAISNRGLVIGGLVGMTGLILTVSGGAVVYAIGQDKARANGRRGKP